jgi:hypothetical protein
MKELVHKLVQEIRHETLDTAIKIVEGLMNQEGISYEEIKNGQRVILDLQYVRALSDVIAKLKEIK